MKTPLFCCVLLLPSAVQANWQLDVTLASEYRFKGFAMSGQQPALQPNLRWQGADNSPLAGYSAGVWLSNTDFINPQTNRGINAEVDWQLGRRWSLDEQWQCEINLLRYQFFGAGLASQVDYSELQTGCGTTQHSVQFAFSQHYGATRNRHSILTLRQQLWRSATWDLQAELSNLRNYDDASFYQAGGAGYYQHLQLNANYQPPQQGWSSRVFVGSENDSAAFGTHWYSGVELAWHF